MPVEGALSPINCDVALPELLFGDLSQAPGEVRGGHPLPVLGLHFLEDEYPSGARGNLDTFSGYGEHAARRASRRQVPGRPAVL